MGDLVVTDLEKWRGYIQVAEVLEIDGEDVKIAWFDGTLTSKFTPRFENGGRHTELITRDSICLHGFTFTALGRLRAHVKDIIRDLLKKQSLPVPGSLSDDGGTVYQ